MPLPVQDVLPILLMVPDPICSVFVTFSVRVEASDSDDPSGPVKPIVSPLANAWIEMKSVRGARGIKQTER